MEVLVQGEILDAQVAMADGFLIVVVLEPDETVGSARLGILPAGHNLIIDAHQVFLSVASNLKGVPLAYRFGIGFCGGGKGVDGPGAPSGVFGGRVANFHLVPLVHGHPGILPWIREPQKHPRIGNVLLLHEFAAKDEVGELPPRIPPQAHAAFAGRDAVGDHEPPGTALLPLPQGIVREKRHEIWRQVDRG